MINGEHKKLVTHVTGNHFYAVFHRQLIFYYSIYIDDRVFLTVRHLWSWFVSWGIVVIWWRNSFPDIADNFFFNCRLSFYKVAV